MFLPQSSRLKSKVTLPSPLGFLVGLPMLLSPSKSYERCAEMFAKFTMRLVINLRIGHTPNHSPTIADKKWSKAISSKFWSNHFCVWPCPLLWEVLSSPARSGPGSPSCFANWSSHWSSSCRQINLITNTVWAKSFKINPFRHNSLFTLSSCALALCEWHLPLLGWLEITPSGRWQKVTLTHRCS